MEASPCWIVNSRYEVTPLKGRYGAVCKHIQAADPLASIYACLSQEVTSLDQQDLQRVIPFFWNVQSREAPAFYDYDAVTFLDIRSCTQEERWRLQAILIDMEIPYYVQKRLLLVIYAEGIELENFRLRTFQEQIKIPFGKEEGSLQCSFVAGANNDIWTANRSCVCQYEILHSRAAGW